MKLFKYAFLVMVLLFSATSAGTSLAASKYESYQALVQATVGATAGAKEKEHGNKFCREKMERAGLGGTVLPSVAESDQKVPKNYR